MLAGRIGELGKSAEKTQIKYEQRVTLGDKEDESVVAIVGVDSKKYIYVIEAEKQGFLQKVFGKPKEYSVAMEVVILSRGLHEDAPEYFDADGDGCKEVFIRLTVLAGDRVITTFLMLGRSGGSWRGHVSPILAPVIREQVGDVGMYLEDFKQAVEFEGQKHYMQPISIGDWKVLDRDGGGKSFAALISPRPS